MPWKEVSVMEERREFVRLARLEGSNRRELCRRFGIFFASHQVAIIDLTTNNCVNYVPEHSSTISPG